MHRKRAILKDNSAGCSGLGELFQKWPSNQIKDHARGLRMKPAIRQPVVDILPRGGELLRIARNLQTVDAYKYLESNAQVGKVVITVP